MKTPRFLLSLVTSMAALGLMGQSPALLGYVNGLELLAVNVLTVAYGWRQGLVAAVAGMLLQFTLPQPDESLMSQLFFQSLLLGLVADSLRASPKLKSQLLLQGAELLEAREKLEVLSSAQQLLKQEVELLGDVQGALSRLAEQILALTSVEEVQATLVAVAATQFTAGRGALWGLEGEEFRVLASYGWSDAPETAPVSELPLVMQAYDEKTLRSIQNYPISGSAGNQPAWLWACPLVNPLNGRVLGVLTLDRVPFHRFTRGYAATLEAICGMGARALGQLHRDLHGTGQSAEAWEWQDLLSPSDFLRKLRRACLELAQGGSSNFCVLSIRNPGGLPVAERAALVVARCNLRPEDLAGKNRRGDLLFMLSNTRLEAARRLLLEMSQQLREFAPCWFQGNPDYWMGVVEGDCRPEAEQLLVCLEEGLKPCHLMTN